ncbi:MAG TPA: zinc ribbon domain-containing protein [Polyangiaceae bacterium]|nr:zinc ribbon domain-containing protein [Polyangiaceae bacterium]
MPTYEYVCKSCGYGWEAQQRISEAALTECPKCQKATAQRQISGGNFILKGGGWYADLYSSSPKKSESGSSPTTTDKPKTEPPKAASSPPPSTGTKEPSKT